jgi:hypothetical protein
MKFGSFFGLFSLFCIGVVSGQVPGAKGPDTLSSQGGWVRREIINGDTFYLSTLRTVKIAGPRQYKDRAERDRLARYRRYAANVYPYALQAIELYDEVESAKQTMNKREHKRFVRSQKKIMKEDFEEKLKKLYKTEGMILIKMIERQTNQSCYEIVRETRGPIVATYWQNMGKIWGFDLKEGYIVGADPLLDEVLLDYDFGDAIWRY